MACILPVLMQHHHITDRKGMPGKIRRTVYIEPGINIFKAHAFLQLPGVDQSVILFRNRDTLHFKIIHCHKPYIPCFLRIFKLIDTKPALISIQKPHFRAWRIFL